MSSEDPKAMLELASTFLVEIDNISVMSFKTAEMDDPGWSEIKHRVGNDPLVFRTSPGLKDPVTIKLARALRVGGMAAISEIEDWYASAAKKTGAVVGLNRSAQEIFRYSFDSGWIKKLTRPKFDAMSNDAAAEWEIEISAPALTLKVA